MRKNSKLVFLFIFSVFFFSDYAKANYWLVIGTYRQGPGSSIPKKRDITFKWAVLLTGINSVNPWIKPYKINSKYSKNY